MINGFVVDDASASGPPRILTVLLILAASLVGENLLAIARVR